MGRVILMPKAAVEAVCHEDQMVIWSGDLVGALSGGKFLRDDLQYDEIIELHECVSQEIRRIVGVAFDHPEAKTIKQRKP